MGTEKGQRRQHEYPLCCGREYEPPTRKGGGVQGKGKPRELRGEPGLLRSAAVGDFPRLPPCSPPGSPG